MYSNWNFAKENELNGLISLLMLKYKMYCCTCTRVIQVARRNYLVTFRASQMALLGRYREVTDGQQTRTDRGIGMNWTQRNRLGRRGKLHLASRNPPSKERHGDSQLFVAQNSRVGSRVLETKVRSHQSSIVGRHFLTVAQTIVAANKIRTWNLRSGYGTSTPKLESSRKVHTDIIVTWSFIG